MNFLTQLLTFGVLSISAASAMANPEPLLTETVIDPIDDVAEPRPPRQWSFVFDNDFLGRGNTDRDYSAGLRLTTWREGNKSTQAGLLIYTPDDLSISEPQTDDRPYANLLYAARSFEHLGRDGRSLTRSTYSLGLIGSFAGEAVQRSVHSIFDAEEPQGYDHQISDGGELTARVGWSQFKPLSHGNIGTRYYSVISETAVSAGYLTEVSYGLGIRATTQSHWWGDAVKDFQTQLDDPVRKAVSQNYWYAGARVRARGYNSLLQGQFRDSEVTFNSNQLNPVIGEAWIGVARRWQGWQMKYAINYQSAEIKSQYGGRSQVYGSLSISRAHRFAR